MDFLKGRVNRTTYLVQLALVVALYGALIVFNVKPGGAEVVVVVLAVPRLHDLGRSGWWSTLFIAGQMVLVAWALGTGVNAETLLMASGLYTLASLGALIVLGLMPGQKAANRFGPPPRRGFQWQYGKAEPEA